MAADDTMAEARERLSLVKERWQGLSPGLRRALLGGGVAIVALALLGPILLRLADDRAYLLTKLDASEGQEALAVLRAAGIEGRLEAGGEALSVDRAHLYDARLILAQAGLPRDSKVGFEIFDRSDLGISEFTQKVNLRRALEGEIARTIESLREIRSARVHLTLPKRSLFQKDDHPATASVVVHLRAGASLSHRQAAGIQHLVASAVPGLEATAVDIVDGSGTMIAGAESVFSGALADAERALERKLEGRLVSLLEPVIGEGGVIVRARVEMDPAKVDETSQTFDPDTSALRSEHTVVQETRGATQAPGGIAGATANTPGASGGATTKGGGQSATVEDETRRFEVSSTRRRVVSTAPRIQRISIAVLLGGKEGEPLPKETLEPLAALVRSAAGLDEKRGDVLEIRSLPFGALPTGEVVSSAAAASERPWIWIAGGAAALLLLLAVAGVVVARRRRARREALRLLAAGQRVSEIETVLAAEVLEEGGEEAAEGGEGSEARDPRQRARELAALDPLRAARLLTAWIEDEASEVSHA